MPHFPFKSYCWAVGTTSFRMVNFNVQIERQLDLIDNFWSMPENAEQSWRSNKPLQTAYYDYLESEGFLGTDAPRHDKDARQKTSGLIDIGLIDTNRKLTNAGQALLDIVRNANFARDNLLQIPADSFVYLKQLIKTHINVGGIWRSSIYSCFIRSFKAWLH